MSFTVYILLVITSIVKIDCSNDSALNVVSSHLFDDNLYKDVLDPDLCSQQLQYLFFGGGVDVLLSFLDAGSRIPRGLVTGNLMDWGNYHQCLGIRHEIEDSVIQGKYCSIRVPLQQQQIDMDLEELISLTNVSSTVRVKEDTYKKLGHIRNITQIIQMLIDTNYNGVSRSGSESLLSSFAFSLAICVPEVCSTTQIVEYITSLTLLNINYNETYCRLPNDKPVTVDTYVAIAIFSFIGLLTIISTSYDLYHTLILKKELKEANAPLCSFSVYTNTRSLFTFNTASDSITCMDGIRAISIIWIICGHTISSAIPYLRNPLDFYEFLTVMGNVWIMAAPIAVDTFFAMSGVLLVYTTAGKLNTDIFLRNIHFFYIRRYLRLLPLLAAVVFLHGTLIHYTSDGPIWNKVGIKVQDCRDYWWSTLLYVQNYINPDNICIPQSWYLSIDMQLYWISPLVLVWVLSGRRRIAWIALCGGFLASLTAGSVYSCINNFQSSPLSLARTSETTNYMDYYYGNTMTRSSPFFVGTIFGYILHLWRGKKVKIPHVHVILFWVMSIAVFSFVVFIIHPTTQEDYDNQILDNFLNSCMRPMWAAALGWLIFACAHGYGGPVNWFLSLNIWKPLAKLSYAMYLTHTCVLVIQLGSLVSPLYFTRHGMLYRFCADLVVTIIISFVLTLLIDYPCSNLQTLLIGGPKSRVQQVKSITPQIETINDSVRSKL